MNLLKAMAWHEGFGAPDQGNRPNRNNNPGNITHGDFTKRYGAKLEIIPEGYRSVPRFAAFPDAATGWRAMEDLLRGPSYRGLTVRQMLTRWAPPSENDTEEYIRYIVDKVGCAEDEIIDDLIYGN